jgi:hypothetical protein
MARLDKHLTLGFDFMIWIITCVCMFVLWVMQWRIDIIYGMAS